MENEASDKKKDIKRGVQDGIPIALGYLSVSFAFGIMAVSVLNKIMEQFAEINDETRNSKNVRRIMKLKETMKAGYLEEYYHKVDGYIKQWKEEYRNEIGADGSR